MKKAVVLCCIAAAALLSAVFGAHTAYVAHYVRLYEIMRHECNARPVFHVLIYGGYMPDAALNAARELAPRGASIILDRSGAAYGYAVSDSAYGCAASEFRLRGIFGASARSDRWISAALARASAGRNRAADIAVRLLARAGEAAITHYSGRHSASVRGARYHAAVRTGPNIEYMLAEGYLPIDY